MDFLLILAFLVMLFTTGSVIGAQYGRDKLHRSHWSRDDSDLTAISINFNKHGYPVAKLDLSSAIAFGLLLPMFALLYGGVSLLAWYGITDALDWLAGYKPASLFVEGRNGEYFQAFIFGLTLWAGFWYGRSRLTMFAALKAIAYAESQQVGLDYKSVFLMAEKQQ